MREIGSVRQDSERGYRRWFQDDYFDLFVWQDAAGRPIAFQLCYDRANAEGAISWSETHGFAHARVDASAKQAKYGMSPILRCDGVAPYFRIYNRFLAAADWDPGLHRFVVERLREYRRVLFGTRRTPRRRREARS
ncbi:MAG: hypothetical protein ACREUX_03910 [Burkholderiales bacterium]